MRLPLYLLFALLPAAGVAAPIYKHVDAHGNVVYTDQPPEGAEEVALPPVNTVKGEPPKARPADAPVAPAFPGYRSLLLIGVADGTLLQNPQAGIRLSAVPDPGLREGDRILLTLDGKVVSESGNYEISRPERGEFVVGASIVDDRGNVLIEASPIRFTVQKPLVRPQPVPGKKSP